MSMLTYTLITFGALVLQATLVPYMAIYWFRPDLPLIILLHWAARRGPFEGVIAGFVAGILIDAVSTGFPGLSSLCYTLAAFVAGKLFYSDIPIPFNRWAVISLVGALVYAFVFAYFYALHSQPDLGVMLVQHALLITLYTWGLAMVWAMTPLFERRMRVNI